jgi:anthranilate synthase component 1
MKICIQDAQEEARKLKLSLSSKTDPAQQNKPSRITPNIEKSEYEYAVRKAKKHIMDGNIFQVVLSRRYEVTTDQTPLGSILK